MISQLKYSVRHPTSTWTAARLSAPLSGRASVIKRLSAIYRGLLEDVGRARELLPKLQIALVSNQPAAVGVLSAVPTKVVSERLSHASVGITLDVYSHVLPGMDQEAADRIAGILDGVKPGRFNNAEAERGLRRVSSRMQG